MALFNKLFSSRKKSTPKQQDTICEKIFVFSKDQVRIILFRECDFRGRKLLFDSHSVQKVPLSAAPNASTATITNSNQSCRSQNTSNTSSKPEEKYIEISNGFGYQYTKPNSDISQLGEMIFGSVAMSYRGTSFKIHSLKSPSRLMCSQIFPSPRYPSRGRCSAPNQSYARSSVASSQSLEQSVRLDDSGTSSVNSMSDHLSVHSTGSDTLLICRGARSVPLDVPTSNASIANSSNLTPSLIGDSGFSGEQSYNSIDSGPQSLPLSYSLNDGFPSFSCGSLYKRWLRSASTSLEHSMNSLTGSASADECLLKPQSRNSKLGLAVIIELSADQEQYLEQFLMEHVALIEAMVWKTRQAAELAYIRHNNFVSLMFEVASNTIQWLVDLLSGPQLATHMWISLASVCDKFNSINDSDSAKSSYNFTSKSDMNRTLSSNASLDEKSKTFTNSNSSVSLNTSFKTELSLSSSCDSTDTLDKSNDFTFLNLTKFLRNEWTAVNARNSYSDRDSLAEKCVTELCELLEYVDVKHTNFFVSTLVTAVLTHHLGWVTTVLPPSSSDKEKVSKLHNPCNPLWGQLTDLYGAIGHPTKVAHTIVTGTNKSELISKILNSLTYFIRCSDTERRCITRIDIKEENRKVDCICQQKSCIPKENYKKYEDHLRELEIVNICASNKSKTTEISKNNVSSETIEMSSLGNLNNDTNKQKEITSNLSSSSLKPTSSFSLTKTHTYLSDLSQMTEEAPKKLYCDFDKDCDNNRSTLLPQKSDNSPALLHKVKSLNIQAVESFPIKEKEAKKYELSNEIINDKVRRLCRVPASATLYHMKIEDKEKQQLVDIREASEQIKKVFSPKKLDVEKQMSAVSRVENVFEVKEDTESDHEQKGVIFVLGDNEELIGLKKDNNSNFDYALKVNNSEEYCGSFKKDTLSSSDLSVKFENSEEKPLTSIKLTRPSTLSLTKSKSTFFTDSQKIEQENDAFPNSQFKDSDFQECIDKQNIKPSTSWTSLELSKKSLLQTGSEKETATSTEDQKIEFNRAQSVPPETKKSETTQPTEEKKSKYRYSGVKFNFQQYPQIVKNYMRSKNLELSQLPFAEKAMKLTTLGDYPTFDFSNYDSEMEEVETLQTPSNASELEFTSDLITDNYEMQHAKEEVERKTKTFVRNYLPNTVVQESNTDETFTKTTVIDHPLKICDKVNNALFEHEKSNSSEEEPRTDLKAKLNKMEIIELPMPKSEPVSVEWIPVTYTNSLMRGISERYVSDMVLQGISAPKSEWESVLRRDLSMAARHPLLDQPIDEAVAIVANTDTWEVQLLSSHTYVVDRGSSGVRVGMSQLVANMLESLLQMWKLHTPPEYCIMHIEQRLQEFCTLSKALSELLLATEFCSMELLTSVLQLEVNDVPLLMAVASTHSPQVTQKYGLSFQ